MSSAKICAKLSLSAHAAWHRLTAESSSQYVSLHHAADAYGWDTQYQDSTLQALLIRLVLDNHVLHTGFGKVEKRVRTTAGGASGSVRNLRIREDTAKYLLNLDPTSAHYDPKSRSMREDPNPMKNPQEKSFMGDNFVRKSGDYHQWEALTLHSFQAHDRGQDMHVQVGF